MGRIGLVDSFEKRTVDGVKRSEVRVDLGGGDIVTAICYFPPGRFSEPLRGDYVFLVDGPGTGNYIALGFLDPKLDPPTTAAGEEAVFSRSALGTIAAKAIFRTDGSIDFNDNATLDADGNLTTAGSVEAEGEVTAAAATAPVNLTTHKHPTGMGPSGPPTPEP